MADKARPSGRRWGWSCAARPQSKHRRLSTPPAQPGRRLRQRAPPAPGSISRPRRPALLRPLPRFALTRESATTGWQAAPNQTSELRVPSRRRGLEPSRLPLPHSVKGAQKPDSSISQGTKGVPLAVNRQGDGVEFRCFFQPPRAALLPAVRQAFGLPHWPERSRNFSPRGSASATRPAADSRPSGLASEARGGAGKPKQPTAPCCGRRGMARRPAQFSRPGCTSAQDDVNLTDS